MLLTLFELTEKKLVPILNECLYFEGYIDPAEGIKCYFDYLNDFVA